MGELMSQKEAKRAQVLDLLKEGAISVQEASNRLGVCVRQARRIVRCYQAEGLAGNGVRLGTGSGLCCCIITVSPRENSKCNSASLTRVYNSLNADTQKRCVALLFPAG